MEKQKSKDTEQSDLRLHCLPIHVSIYEKLRLLCIIFFFMPQTLKKWGAYCFRLVRLFVRLFKKNLKLGF